MAKLTINEVERDFKIPKTTVDKKMRNGELSYEKDDKGIRRVDTEEIQRVFGTMLEKRSKEADADSIKGYPVDTSKFVELIETKAKLEVAEAKLKMLEDRKHELENMLQEEKEQKNHWLELSKRLSLPSTILSTGSSQGSSEDKQKPQKKPSWIGKLIGKRKD